MSVADMRAEVLARDGGCVAPRLDPDAGPCYDRWGLLLPEVHYQGRMGWSTSDWACSGTMRSALMRWYRESLEMDYVRRDSIAPHHVLAEDHAMLCPGHHRGVGPHRGYVWATAHRDEMVEYLRPMRDRLNA
jgi:hypothetical protein